MLLTLGKAILGKTLDKVIASTAAGSVVGAGAQVAATAQSPGNDVLLTPFVREFLTMVAPFLVDYPNFLGLTSALLAGIISGATVGVSGYFKKEKSFKLSNLVTK